MTCPCRTATFIFSVTTYLDLFFIILFCTFSFFQFFSFLALLSFSHFFYLNWRFMGFYLFCGYLVNFTLHTYQSVKWVTILSLLDNTRTAELEFRSFLQPSPIHMMPWTSVAGVIPPVSTAVASSCVPVTLYGVIHTFTTFFFPSSPLNFTIWDHSLIIAKSLFLFWKCIFYSPLKVIAGCRSVCSDWVLFLRAHQRSFCSWYWEVSYQPDCGILGGNTSSSVFKIVS